jgi:Uma2 family endonuclease
MSTRSPTPTRESEAQDPAAGEPAWSVALLFPNQGHWTEADYLGLSTNHLVEFSSGVLEVPEMPSDRHQAIVAFLFSRLMAFVAAGRLGTVRFAPLPVRLWPGKFREPDVLFMRAEHTDRITEAYWGVPDLVMEVVSPGTRQVDSVIKLREYAEAGIPEYWLVDPEAETISLYVLAASTYERKSEARPRDTVRSVAVAGFEITVDEMLAAR